MLIAPFQVSHRPFPASSARSVHCRTPQRGTPICRVRWGDRPAAEQEQLISEALTSGEHQFIATLPKVRSFVETCIGPATATRSVPWSPAMWSQSGCEQSAVHFYWYPSSLTRAGRPRKRTRQAEHLHIGQGPEGGPRESADHRARRRCRL